MAFMGRLTDPREQAAAIEFLPGIAPGEGYEAIFGTLSAAAKRAGEVEPDAVDDGRYDGSSEGVDVAADAAPRGRSNESREFIARDWRGQVEKIAVVLESHPHVQEALDSTSRSARVRRSRDRSGDALAEVIKLAQDVGRAVDEGVPPDVGAEPDEPATAYQEA